MKLYKIKTSKATQSIEKIVESNLSEFKDDLQEDGSST